MVDSISFKICKDCNESKLWPTDFTKSKTGKPQCKQCRNKKLQIKRDSLPKKPRRSRRETKNWKPHSSVDDDRDNRRRPNRARRRSNFPAASSRCPKISANLRRNADRPHPS